MGSDDLFKRRREERKQRKVNVERQKSSNWLIVCEGKETECNYFTKAIQAINKNIEKEYKLRVNIVGKGMNTVSLVKTVENLQNKIDEYKNTIVPYGKIFVVFDKDSFSDELFDEAIQMCQLNGYIPLWSNQAFEYWFLLHFHYIEARMNRLEYSLKITEYFHERGFRYKYQKNDKDIYNKLCKYGSLEEAIKNAKKIYSIHEHDRPSKSESCTTVYQFFDEVNKRIEELK